MSSDSQFTEPNVVTRTDTFTPYPLRRYLSRLRGLPDLKYFPLGPGEIRILVLEPGWPGTDLYCKLKHVSLPDVSDGNGFRLWERLRKPRFEAISYAWGEPIFKYDLHIKGVGKINITKSLYEALQQFRSKFKQRKLWADAVCIDQRNRAERAVQVKMFGKIFESAGRVLVWLGCAEETDAAAIATLSRLDKGKGLGLAPENEALFEIAQKLKELTRCSCCHQPTGIDGEDVHAHLGAATKLLTKAWFSRMWVIQEVLSATKVEICVGTHRTPWSSFLHTLGTLHHLALHGDVAPKESTEYLQEHAHKMSDVAAVFLPRSDVVRRKGFSVNRTLDVMCSFSSFLCSDARDRVFAVRPVLLIEDQEDLRPDYNKVEVNEVFRRLVAFCFAQQDEWSRCYEFLALVGTEVEEEEEEETGKEVGTEITRDTGPSWVPNFDGLTERSRFKHRQYSCLDYRDISTFRESTLDFCAKLSSTDAASLQVRGRIIGRVKEVNLDCSWPELDSDIDLKSAVDKMAKWYRRCREDAIAGCTDEFSDRNLLTFLTRGYCLLSSAAEDRSDEDPIDVLVKAAVHECFSMLSEGDRASCKDSLAFIARESCLKERRRPLYGMHVLVDPKQRFCHVETDEGIVLVWMPSSTVENDLLCVLSGAPYPFALREAGTQGFKLLGDAYTPPLSFHRVFGSSTRDCRQHDLQEPFTDWNHRRIGDKDPQKGKIICDLMARLPWIHLI